MSGGPGRQRPDIPRATYRVQLHAGFDFDAATAIVPYLAALGISHLYTSPITMARPGSEHGYDVVDHTRLNPELGGEAGLERLCTALHGAGMGLLVDFVPNHMGVGGAHNPAWLDVLEWGQESGHADWMDIDWHPVEETLAGKLLVPFLGAPYGEVLESGELALRFDPGSGCFAAWYHEHCFPICPRSYHAILQHAPAALPESVTAMAAQLRRAAAQEGGSIAMKLKAELKALAASPAGRAPLEAAAEAFAGRAGDPPGFQALHDLLEQQAYRLSYWRVAADEINYRRFFDINDLAGLRVEDPRVFDRLHPLLFDLIHTGKVSGVRLDHVDGLYDPAGYCRQLQAEAGRCLGADTGERPLYLLVEKILAPFERVPASWPVHGTTGYDFMAQATGLLIAPDSEQRMTRIYRRFVPDARDFETEVERAKPQILRNNLSSEFTVLARRLTRLAKRHRRTRDFTYHAIREALTDIVARFPVYRTYIAEGVASETDERYISWATRRAIKAPGLVDDTVYEFIRQVLLARGRPDDADAQAADEIREIACKFQQLTGPVTAKSVEDTAFYRYTRFIALNEVGSEPSRWGVSVAAFHHEAAGRSEETPGAMLATATHDHKRGEDLRARLAVLSELPDEWAQALRRFARLNRSRRRLVADAPVPSRSAEYLYYQAVAGAWPMRLPADDPAQMADFAARIEAYMIKAAREAKLETHWARPDEAYEAGLADFVRETLDPRRSKAFLRELTRLVERIAPPGAINGLAQAVLKYTTPGVPDLYQGTEYWDLSLVDPDNRLPVDYAVRRAVLDEIGGLSDLRPLLENWRDGRLKLALVAALLGARRRRPSLFAEGSYEPVEATGPAADRLLAFVRRRGEQALLVVVPRLVAEAVREPARLELDGDAWADTVLAPEVRGFAGARHLFTGVAVPDLRPGPLLASFPVCVLEA
jgi:(1->4)-alpha-D-glucan 1-alpha-D-glucosylmutase